MGTQFNGTQSLNQFSQGPVVGQLDMRTGAGQTVEAVIDSTSAGSLKPGQPVKIYDSGGGVPKVVECATNDDDIFGFIVFDKQKSSFSSGDAVTIAAFRGTVMYMAANAAIARNAKVMIVVSLTNPRVATATSTHTVAGRCLDKAAAQDDLVRVFIDLPGVTPQP